MAPASSPVDRKTSTMPDLADNGTTHSIHLRRYRSRPRRWPLSVVDDRLPWRHDVRGVSIKRRAPAAASRYRLECRIRERNRTHATVGRGHRGFAGLWHEPDRGRRRSNGLEVDEIAEFKTSTTMVGTLDENDGGSIGTANFGGTYTTWHGRLRYRHAQFGLQSMFFYAVDSSTLFFIPPIRPGHLRLNPTADYSNE